MAVASLSTLLAQVRQRESSGNYQAQSRTSTASGAYGYINATWRTEATAAGYGGYAALPAREAPPNVQDAVAAYSATHHDPNSSYLWQASAPAGGYPSLAADAGATFAPSVNDLSSFNLSPNSTNSFGDSHSLDNIPGVDTPSSRFATAPDGFGSGLSTGGAPNDAQGLTSFDANFTNANSDLTNLQLSPDLLANSGFGGSELLSSIPGLSNIGGPTPGGSSNTWWQNLLTNITDLSLRGGLGLLALVLIAAAAFAFAFSRGAISLPASRPNSFLKAGGKAATPKAVAAVAAAPKAAAHSIKDVGQALYKMNGAPANAAARAQGPYLGPKVT